jgi:hypothetical protein
VPDTDYMSLEPSPVLGLRCGRCDRYLVDASTARRGLGGRWRHQSCADAPRPTASQFAALAQVLMNRQPWPRVHFLRTELDDVVDELAQIPVGMVPKQGGPPSIEQVPSEESLRLKELRERMTVLQDAIDEERDWKARRLAVEWADVH